MAEIALRRVVDDVQTLRALADPLRMKLVEFTMADPDLAWTARELAARFGVQPTNIYYHLNLLEKHGLLQIRETRVVNGIVEKHYGAGQRVITFHRAPGDDARGARQLVGLIFREAINQIDAGLAAGTLSTDRESPDAQRMLLKRETASIPEDRIAEFREELLTVVKRFADARASGGHRFTMMVTMYPNQ